jgi:hypothetical protein
MFAVEELAVDERAAELAVIRPELSEDRVDLGLGEPRAQRKGAHHLGEEQAAAAFAGRPAQDAPVTPERSQLTHFLGDDMALRQGHALIVKTKDR